MLRTHKLGEADRIVTLLTRQHGQGARRGQGRAPHQVAVRRPARAVHGRRRPVLRGPQPRHRDPGRDARLLRRRHRPRLRATPPPPSMLETADRLTEEREPALQQYLLLVGALRSLAGGEHDPGLVLDSYLLRSLAVAGWAPSFDDCASCGAPGPHSAFDVAAGRRGLPGLPPARARPRPRPRRSAARALLTGDWACRRRLRPRAPPRGQRPGRGVPPVAPRARPPLLRACRADERPSPSRTPTPFPHPSGARPPADPARRRSCPTTSRSSWTATAAGPTRAACPARRATRRARPRCSTSSPGRSRSGSPTCRPTRSRPRTGSARPTRCASSWASTATCIRRRRDQMHEWGVRVRWVGRPPAAVGHRSSTSSRSPRSSPATTTC